MADKFKSKEILLNGKLVTSRDAATIGENNFQTLTNLRYTDTNPQGVLGMSKINKNTALTNAKMRSGFHFRKDSPSESHVLVNSFNAGETQGYIYDNETAIPAQGDFTATAVLTQDSSAGTAHFSTAPGGYVAMCDKAGAYVWGGDEANTGAFITSTAAVTDSITNPRDYTQEVSNTLQTTAESAVIGGGYDSYTKLLLHFGDGDGDTTPVDSVGTHTPDADGTDAEVDTAQSVFGSGAGLFAGDDYFTIADHADFDYSTGTLTIDTRVRFSAVTGQHAIYAQGVATGDHVTIFQDHDTSKLWFCVMSGGTRLILESATWAPSADTWYHVAVIRGWGAGASAWAITVDGTAIGTFTASVTMPNLAVATQLGNMLTTSAIDFGNTGHALTLTDGAAITNAASKWGDGSLVVDGTNDVATVPDHADWDILTKTNFTISLWAKFDTHAGDEILVQQYEGVGEKWTLGHQHGAGIAFSAAAGGSPILDTGFGGDITDTDWHHIAACKVGDDYGVYLDGVIKAHTNDSSTDTWAGDLYIGSDGAIADPFDGSINDLMITHTNHFTAAPDAGLTDTITVPTAALVADSTFKLSLPFNHLGHEGWLDEYRISKGVARWAANFTPPARPYSASARVWLIGSVLPLTGAKFYVSNPNIVASTTTMKEWNGSSWTSVTLTADGTKPSTISLAQTGSMTWASTVDTSVVKYLYGSVMYWYQFSITDGDADIYKVTVSAPMQQIKDIWDGIERECLAFWHVDDGTNLDYSLNVFHDNYDSGNTATFCSLDTLVIADDYLLAGFSERMMAASIGIISSNNDVVDVELAVSYWNGAAWAPVTGLVDETTVADGTFAQTGVVSWTPPSREEEFKTDVNNGIPLYYYKFIFTTTNFGNAVDVYHVSGIPAQKNFNAYGFPIHAGGALWLLGDADGHKNSVLKSAPGTVSFWNGDESLEFSIGDDAELIAGSSVYYQLGSNLYEVVLICKKHETWMIVPGATGAQQFRISDKVGCVAPGTMKATHLGSLEQGLGKSVVMWQGADGIYLFDGKAPVKISGDIDDLFLKSNASGLHNSYIDVSMAEFDIENWEYHWFCRTGASGAWAEWVFDLKRGKWYEVSRGAAKMLKCGINVMDTVGNFYMYGGIATGYLERLENGTAFDGNDIVHTLRTGDFVLNEGKVSRTAVIRNARLVGMAKNTTANEIAATYFKDTNTSADESYTISPAASGKRLFQDDHGMGREGKAIFHSFNFSMTTDDETIGFEPIFLSVLYKETGTTKGR